MFAQENAVITSLAQSKTLIVIFRIAICGNCKAPLLTFYAISSCPVGPPRLEAMVTALFEITVSKSQYYFAVIDEKERQSLM